MFSARSGSTTSHRAIADPQRLLPNVTPLGWVFPLNAEFGLLFTPPQNQSTLTGNIWCFSPRKVRRTSARCQLLQPESRVPTRAALPIFETTQQGRGGKKNKSSSLSPETTLFCDPASETSPQSLVRKSPHFLAQGSPIQPSSGEQRSAAHGARGSVRVTAPRTVRWHRGPMAPAGVTAMSPPPPPHRSLFSLLGFYGTGPRGKARSHTAPRRPPSDLGQRGTNSAQFLTFSSRFQPPVLYLC